MKVAKFIALCAIGLIAGAMLGSCVFNSAGKRLSGKIVEKTVDVGMYNKLSVSSGIEVKFVQGQQKPVEISCDEDIFDRVIIEQEGKRLKIKLDQSGDFFKSFGDRVVIALKAEALTEIDASSGATLNIGKGLVLQGPLSVDASSGAVVNITSLKGAVLKTDASSGAVINIERIDTEAVDADASGGAVVTLAGKCNTLGIDASSGAIVNAGDLASSHHKVDSSSGALVNTKVRKSGADGN